MTLAHVEVVRSTNSAVEEINNRRIEKGMNLPLRKVTGEMSLCSKLKI